MADTLTKSVAARVPMDTYIDIIKTAAELRMTVSDYVIMKLFQGSRNEQIEKEVIEKEKIVSQITKELSEARKEKQRLEKVITESTNSTKEKDSIIKQQAAKISTLTTELTSVKKVHVDLKSDITNNDATLNTTRERLKEADSRLKDSQVALRSCQAAKKVSELKAVSLQADIVKLTSTIKSLKKNNAAIYEELKAYNARNTGFFGSEPIGEEFMEKLKTLLSV